MLCDVGTFGEQTAVAVEVSIDIAAVLEAVHDVFEVGSVAEPEGVAGFVNEGEEDDGVAEERVGNARGIGLRQDVDLGAAYAIDRDGASFTVEAGARGPVNGEARVLTAGALSEDDSIAGFALPGFEGPFCEFGIVGIAAGSGGFAGAVVDPPGPCVAGMERGCEEKG